ncbi:methanogenesis marker 7 protein [Methanocella sp. CWC-04]|uniref:Methanogenesis marker 7 protein n=1 Tax=Methanooceanicella nereidis TaxID=2052831 RepID=A0AAP2RE85_9EURY|nr:methanogenesis marker 7 protein [Methanocella sp. CWC-04]MCD1295749.1 methanogenesis marker 7 protein [Methanocella sp. CWC-04]
MEPVMYQGGIYKHEQMLELVEDLGGYILQKNITQLDIIAIMLVPEADMPLVEAKAKELLGKLIRSPLAGTEIAVITPTLAYQHLPHLACDIAEYLRRNGAKTNMIGLARGVGKRVAQLTAYETDLINEHDIALFLFGNFKECIKVKTKLFRDIDVPIVVVGGPEMDVCDLPDCTAYIGGLGRMAHRLKRREEMEKMDQIVNTIGKILEDRRKDLNKDQLSVSPPRVMQEIEKQVPDVALVLSPNAITLNLDGARIKLPYDEYKDKILNIRFDEGVYMREVANVQPSKMRDFILLRIKPKSETGFVI